MHLYMNAGRLSCSLFPTQIIEFQEIGEMRTNNVRNYLLQTMSFSALALKSEKWKYIVIKKL